MSIANVFLLEDSRGNITKLLKLPKEVADFFHKKDPKNSFFLAKLFKADFKDGIENNPKILSLAEYWYEDNHVDNIVKHMSSSKIQSKIQSKLKSINTVDDFNDEIDAILKADKVKEKNIKIKFKDGFKWIILDAEDCKEEGEMMQHCASDQRGDLYSLRDKSGEPHVTLTFNSERKTIFQIKGKQNKQPDKKYWEYVKKFVEKTNANVQDPELSTEFVDFIEIEDRKINKIDEYFGYSKANNSKFVIYYGNNKFTDIIHENSKMYMIDSPRQPSYESTVAQFFYENGGKADDLFLSLVKQICKIHNLKVTEFCVHFVTTFGLLKNKIDEGHFRQFLKTNDIYDPWNTEKK